MLACLDTMFRTVAAMVSLFARLAITILIIVNVCSRTTEDHNDLRLPQLAEAALKCASSPASPLAKPIDVIAFYNAKSGDQLGKTLAKHFASLIGFESVHDLTQLKSARNICKAVIQAQNQWQKRRVQQKQHPMQPQLQSVDVQSDSEDEADLPRIKAKTLELNPELELNSEPDSDSDADESNHPTAPNSQPATAVDTRQPNAGNYQFILVAGGDGTVQWVQSSLVFCKQHYAKQFKQQFGFTEFPPVVPLPLGTGNDMSSSCGWGSTFPLPPLLAVLRGKGGGLFNRQNSIRQQIKQRLCHIATQSRLIPFDMWNLQYTTQQARPSKIVPLYPVPAALHINKRDTKLRTHMSNYISFGSEADVTRGFQNAREQSPTWHKSRLSNKRSYLLAGMRNLFKRSRPVQKMLTIEIQKRDSFGRPGQQWFSLSNLPANHKTVLISNLPNYATYPAWDSGQWKTSPAKLAQWQPQSFNDGQLEILSTHNSWTGGCAFWDFCRNKRLVQATAVRITLHTKTYVGAQIDGEAFQATDGVILITRAQSVDILVNPNKKSSWIATNKQVLTSPTRSV